MRLFYPSSFAYFEDLDVEQQEEIRGLMDRCPRPLDHDLTPETIARTPDDNWKLEICSAYGDNEVFVDRTTRSRVQDVPDMELENMRNLVKT